MLFDSLPKQSKPNRFRDNDPLLRDACNARLAAVGGHKVTCTGKVPVRADQNDFLRLVTIEPNQGRTYGCAQVSNHSVSDNVEPNLYRDPIGPLWVPRHKRYLLDNPKTFKAGKAQGWNELNRKRGKALPAGIWIAESAEPIRQRVGLAGMQYLTK